MYDLIITDYAEPPNWCLVIAAVAANQLMTVGIAERTVHHERRVQVSCGACVLAETVYTDGKSETALNAVFRMREILGVERE